MSSTDTTVAARQPLSIRQRFDRQLGRVTMYRLVVLALAALVVLAFALSAVRPNTVTNTTPIAAGLTMCRPRNANRYFDADANPAASARASSSSGSLLGQSRKNNSNAVMIVDSECGCTANNAAYNRFDR